MTEVYKSLNHLNPEIMWEFVSYKRINELRYQVLLGIPYQVYLITYAFNAVCFRTCLLRYSSTGKISNPKTGTFQSRNKVLEK